MMSKFLLSTLLLILGGCVSPIYEENTSSTSSGVEWYTPMPNTVSERDKNQWACEQIYYLNEAIVSIVDEAVATNQNLDMDLLIQDYIDSHRALALDIQTPFGDYLEEHADGMESEYFNPDSSDYEATVALGSALNNGEALDPEPNSLIDRCSRLGVNLLQ